MIKINAKDTVYTIVTNHPRVIDILVDFGFTQIKLPQMIQTAGRLMTLKKGCDMRGFDYDQLKEVLHNNGFEVVE